MVLNLTLPPTCSLHSYLWGPYIAPHDARSVPSRLLFWEKDSHVRKYVSTHTHIYVCIQKSTCPCVQVHMKCIISDLHDISEKDKVLNDLANSLAKKGAMNGSDYGCNASSDSISLSNLISKLQLVLPILFFNNMISIQFNTIQFIHIVPSPNKCHLNCQIVAIL